MDGDGRCDDNTTATMAMEGASATRQRWNVKCDNDDDGRRDWDGDGDGDGNGDGDGDKDGDGNGDGIETVRIKTDFDIPARLFKTRKVFTLEAKIISSQLYQNKVFGLSQFIRPGLYQTESTRHNVGSHLTRHRFALEPSLRWFAFEPLDRI